MLILGRSGRLGLSPFDRWRWVDIGFISSAFVPLFLHPVMYLCRLRVPNCATRRRYTIHKHVYATSIIVHASHSRKQRNSTTQQYPVILTRTTTENIPLSLVFVSFANSAKHCNPWCKWPGPRRTHITPSSRAPSPAAQETKTGKFEVGAISKAQKSAIFFEIC